MLIVIDAVGIRGHGGAAVLSELLHWLPRVRPDWRWHVFLFARSLREFDDPPPNPNVVYEYTHRGDKGIGRLRWVYSHLPRRLLHLGANAVLSFANVGAPRPPIPQIIFCHRLTALVDADLNGFPLLQRARLGFMRSCILRGARHSRAVIVQTDSMRRRFIELEPALASRVYVIPSGFRTPASIPNVRAELKSRIAATSRPRLIYVSHPSEHKNHDILIHALANIRHAIPSAQLLLTIDEQPNNKRYQGFVKNIQKIAVQNRTSENTTFLGVLTPDEVSYALSESDLMVFPSLAESFGLPLAESMAAGCPIAASDLPYAHDVAGPAAVYFDPNDARSISDCVLSVLRNPESLSRLRGLGQERCRRFEYQSIANSFVGLLQACTA
jgi:glycosyltransferase involved in cell wall biosynthesis